eukprot:GHVS01060416.1.p1 GENE.GHVS01060416.1~~GHVS01060416.1.p1  ORF type:complete len:622 (-),score=90.95 GHVS01060416.1:253-2118(-)
MKANGSCHERKTMPIHKYSPFPPVPFDSVWSSRKWPSNVTTSPPRWCSVDLRDGNQALVNPMSVEKKLAYFRLLISMGFKEIEIGFPSASDIDFDFCRRIITDENIPSDVWLSVLVQSREQLIERSIAAVVGAKNVIIHLYNSTSALQRDVVFRQSREGIIELAVSGTKLIRKLVDDKLRGANVRLEYSPESFTGTELDFALAIAQAVAVAWNASPSDILILNLPATVEMCTPNIFADMIEWMVVHLAHAGLGQSVEVSVHPHNDRGTAIAAAELSLLAGVGRVEGCLFGNGERSGNVCLVTLAMNLFTQGTDPLLDLSGIPSIIRLYEDCTEMSVPPRHPWAGSLVFTAFSGSHQDAIRKGLEALPKRADGLWQVPYLPVDPADIGRTYEAIVRINAQSGKGGVAFVLENNLGISVPREVQVDFSRVVQKIADQTATEIPFETIVSLFYATYLRDGSAVSGSVLVKELFLVFEDSSIIQQSGDTQGVLLKADLLIYGKSRVLQGTGRGPVDAFLSAINKFEAESFPARRSELLGELSVVSLYQTSVRGTGESDAEAMSFVRVHRKNVLGGAEKRVEGGKEEEVEAVRRRREGMFGVGTDRNTMTATMKAICSSVNRLLSI